jgi:O-antigen ligase
MVLAALIVYTSLCFCFYTLREKDFKWKIDGVGTGLGFFLIFMLVSSIFSFNAKKSILVWGLYLIFAGYFFIITNAVKTRQQLYSIIKVFVIAGFFVSIYGIAQYFFGWNTQNAWIDEEMFENATMRAYSTMENPNVLGEYLLLVIPLSVFLMLNTGFKTLEKWFYMGTAAVSVICMILTQSRGCWIGLFAAAAIFVTFYNGRLWGLLPFAILALPFVLPQTMIDRFMSVGNLEDSSTSYRVFIWLGTISMLRDFWIGGIGMGEGAFRSVYPFYSYNSIIAPHSHNLYLQLLTEGGICALIIFLITIAVYLKKMSVTFSKNGKNSSDGIFALAAICAVLGFLVQSMFDYTFYNYRMMSMFFMVNAFSCCLWNFKEVDAVENS